LGRDRQQGQDCLVLGQGDCAIAHAFAKLAAKPAFGCAARRREGNILCSQLRASIAKARANAGGIDQAKISDTARRRETRAG
jgi:hypothetical protein